MVQEVEIYLKVLVCRGNIARGQSGWCDGQGHVPGMIDPGQLLYFDLAYDLRP